VFREQAQLYCCLPVNLIANSTALRRYVTGFGFNIEELKVKFALPEILIFMFIYRFQINSTISLPYTGIADNKLVITVAKLKFYKVADYI
jgi:hypothetical protein